MARRCSAAVLTAAFAAGTAVLPSSVLAACDSPDIEECAAAAEPDASALLQMHGQLGARQGHSAPVSQVSCKGTKASCESQARILVESAEPATSLLNVFTMPQAQDDVQLEALGDRLEDIEPPHNFGAKLPGVSARFSEGPAEEVALAMYNATRVAGVSSLLPKDLQGVFWLKNAGAATLVSYQYAAWHPDQGLYVTPFAPFTQAWAGGKPEGAGEARGYTDGPEAAWRSLDDHLTTLTTISKKFSSCKDGLSRTAQPIVCDSHDSLDRFAYASAQAHFAGDLAHAVDYKVGKSPTVEQTLQKATAGGSHWNVLIQQGSESDCATDEVYSVDLLQIIDADGSRVAHNYQDFVDYMGATPLMAWSGWTDGASRDEHKSLVMDKDSEYWSYINSLPTLRC